MMSQPLIDTSNSLFLNSFHPTWLTVLYYSQKYIFAFYFSSWFHLWVCCQHISTIFATLLLPSLWATKYIRAWWTLYMWMWQDSLSMKNHFMKQFSSSLCNQKSSKQSLDANRPERLSAHGPLVGNVSRMPFPVIIGQVMYRLYR